MKIPLIVISLMIIGVPLGISVMVIFVLWVLSFFFDGVGEAFLQGFREGQNDYN